MAWQVQEAKQKFSELLRRASQEGPQVVTRHGEEVAVLLSAETYRKLTYRTGRDFKQFLIEAPDFRDLEIERPTEPAREVEL